MTTTTHDFPNIPVCNNTVKVQRWLNPDYQEKRAARDRVNKGVKLLTKHFGADWPRRVQVGVLDLASARHCVIGQLVPLILAALDPNYVGPVGRSENETFDYTNACEQLGLRDVADQEAHGFESGYAHGNTHVNYNTLQLTWENKLGALQRQLATLS